jgi:hypothetical protein
VEVTLRQDPKRTDGPEHAALDAVDRVDAVAIADAPTVTSAREVEILREGFTSGLAGTLTINDELSTHQP